MTTFLGRGSAGGDVIFGEHNRQAIQEVRTKSEAQNARQLAEVLRPIPSQG